MNGYFAYLEAIKQQLPEEVYAFASYRGNYDLTNHQSLHDAWLQSICVLEPAEGERAEIRRLEIQCRFLGPYHDRIIELTYSDVRWYSLRHSLGGEARSANSRGHGDMLIHEIRLGQDCIVHEMNFSDGAVFEIGFAGFEHTVTPRV
ncbi:MAG TPA: hypothetical protein VHA82_00830 [Ramlibacter sp.]|nr:hypothetical protein [Ramlibacter sp.]